MSISYFFHPDLLGYAYFANRKKRYRRVFLCSNYFVRVLKIPIGTWKEHRRSFYRHDALNGVISLT